MRVDSIQLAQAMVRAQSTINPAAKVQTGRANATQEASAAAGPEVSQTQRSKKSAGQKKKRRKNLNWDGLGGEVDVWV